MIGSPLSKLYPVVLYAIQDGLFWYDVLFWLCKQKGIKIPDLLWLARTDDHDVIGCSIIPFCLQSQNSTS
jgi:hypothetical protein